MHAPTLEVLFGLLQLHSAFRSKAYKHCTTGNRNTLSPDLLDLDGASDGNENEDLRAESDIDSDTNEDASDDEHGHFLSAEEVANLQGNMWGDVYMDVYPGSHAGAIHSQGIPTTKEFENVLGGPVK